MTNARRFRYRLTSLLALMAVIAIGSAAYGNRLRQFQRQQLAFQQIASKGGEVLAYTGGTSILFHQTDGFLCGTGLVQHVSPATDSVSFSDDDVSVLDNVLNLRYVDFQGTAVSATRIASFQA